MAIRAVIPFFGVRFMTELDVAGTGRKLIPDRARGSRMALFTAGLDTESGFVVMATAAGFPLFHLTHRKMLVTGAWNKKVRMAIFAAIGGNVNRVAELGAAGTEVDLFYRMAFLAVGFNAKGGLTVVAGTA